MVPLWESRKPQIGASIGCREIEQSGVREPAAPVIEEIEEEDEKTLAAMDEGIRDAKTGRIVPAEPVRKLVPKWTPASSPRKKR
jgi:predicted transcriptional regulator